MRIFLLFSCFCLLILENVLAQSPQAINFRIFYDLENPYLEGNNLWIPTATGLIRYDITNGAQTVYKPDNCNMEGSTLSNISKDGNGNLWCTGLFKGLLAFDGTSFTEYKYFANGDSISHTKHISSDTSGNVYIEAQVFFASGGSTYDIVKFDGINLTRMNVPSPPYNSGYNNGFTVLPNGEIFSISHFNSPSTTKTYHYNGTLWDSISPPITGFFYLLKDHNLDIWLIPEGFMANTSAYTFYKLNGNSWIATPVSFITPPTSNIITAYYSVNANNEVYFGYGKGIVLWNGGNLSFVPYTPIAPPSVYADGIRGVQIDNSGNVWATYFDFQDGYPPVVMVLKYDGNVWQNYPINKEFDGNAFNIMIDNFNRKWASGNQGIFQFIGGAWQRVPFNIPNVAYSSPNIGFDKDGNVWAILGDTSSITNNSGLYMYDGVQWNFIQQVAGSGVTLDHLGRILVYGTKIEFYDGNTWQSISLGLGNLPFTGHIVRGVADKNNNFWLCSNDGELIHYDGTTFTVLYTSPNIASDFLQVDSLDNLWAGGGGTPYVYRFDLNNMPSVSSYSQISLSLPLGGGPYMGTTDLSGNVWMATTRGLMKETPTGWIKYDIHNADFMDNIIQRLAVDNANNIWVTDNGGITVFNESGIPSNFIQTNQPPFTGNIYYDSNSNGLKDGNEWGLPNQEVLILPDSAVRISSLAGNYQFYPDTGNYVLQMQPYPNWQITSDSTAFHATANPMGMSGLDFGLNALLPVDSLAVHVFGSTQCSLWGANFWLTYQNKGNTILDGDVVLTIDSLTVFSIYSPSYAQATQLSAYSYSWSFQNLLPFETRTIDCRILMPNGLFLGSLIDISATANANATSATYIFSDTLTCAWDPNDKTAFFPPNSTQGQDVLYDTPFEYLIRFQNTGTDVAFNVIIRDTLDSDFDMQTFEFIAASHPVEVLYEMNGILEFRFINIMLPDSNMNEPESHGFVSYRVKPKAGVPNNSLIENTAYIYFDSNPAVVTNTAQHNLVNAFTATESAENLLQAHFYPNPFSDKAFLIYNNPNNNNYILHLYDLNGKEVQHYEDNKGEFEILRQNLSAGMYLYQLVGEHTFQGKLIVK